LGEINNTEGLSPKYTIDITYTDCYEISYNNMMMRTIGDVVLTDMINMSKSDDAYISKKQMDDDQYNILKELDLHNNSYSDEDQWPDIYNDIFYKTFGNLGTRSIDAARPDENGDFNQPEVKINFPRMDETGSFNSMEVKRNIPRPGFISNAVGQVAGHVFRGVKSLVNRALLGNLYTYSATQLVSQIGELSRGNLIKTGMTVAQYIKNAKNRKATAEPATGNIYEGDMPATDSTGRKPIVVNKASKQLGNIFSASTLANNL
jgi:hypothetical protein